VSLVANIDSCTDALLLQTAQVAALGEPRDEQSNFLEGWFIHSSGGDNFQHGNELFGTWSRSHQPHDYVVLVQTPVDDTGIARLLKPGVRAAYDRIAEHWRWKKVRDLTLVVVRSTVH
jgi:hypothetical protein